MNYSPRAFWHSMDVIQRVRRDTRALPARQRLLAFNVLASVVETGNVPVVEDEQVQALARALAAAVHGARAALEAPAPPGEVEGTATDGATDAGHLAELLASMFAT